MPWWLHRPGAEHLPQALVAALADEVQVELAQRGHEPVGIADDVAMAVGPHQLDSGLGGRLRRRTARRARPGATLRSAPLDHAVRDQRHLGGAGLAEADQPAAVGLFVGAQHPVGIGVGAGEQGGELGVERRHRRQVRGGPTDPRPVAPGRPVAPTPDRWSAAEDLGHPHAAVGGDHDPDPDVGEARVDHVGVVAGAVDERRVDGAHGRTEADVLPDVRQGPSSGTSSWW